MGLVNGGFVDDVWWSTAAARSILIWGTSRSSKSLQLTGGRATLSFSGLAHAFGSTRPISTAWTPRKRELERRAWRDAVFSRAVWGLASVKREMDGVLQTHPSLMPPPFIEPLVDDHDVRTCRLQFKSPAGGQYPKPPRVLQVVGESLCKYVRIALVRKIIRCEPGADPRRHILGNSPLR
jgi:hypothetical protein